MSQNTVNSNIAKVRELMNKGGIDAVIIPSGDPHMSEYASDHYSTRAFITGFSGSAGTAVITMENSGLWTDGRYYVQAAKQLEGSEIELFKASEPTCPSFSKYLADTLKSGSVVGLNGRLFSAKSMSAMKKEFEEKGIGLNSDIDYVNDIWEERPAEQFTDVFTLDVKYAGKSPAEKLEQLRNELKSNKADSIVISKLDNIAWLYNIRSNDVECNPVVISYTFVSEDQAVLFTDSSRINAEVKSFLNQNGIEVKGYNDIYEYIKSLDTKQNVLCDLSELNFSLYSAVEENKNLTAVEASDPVFVMKACKNQVENDNTQKAYILDGCALAEFYGWLFEELENNHEYTEWDLVEKLAECRKAQQDNYGDSFTPIIAYKENAAMMHYAPTADNHKKLERSHLLLIDSGGQYLWGTTDITRTFALGEINDTERRDFTYSLKGLIALTNAVFKEGLTGANLDVLCRMPLWKLGLDYRCGTGHGVGYMLNVHEGPQMFNTSPLNTQPLKEGMVLTIEPGVYREGEHGIRTENVVKVVEAMTTEYARFFKFETFTVVPIDTDCVDKSLLTPEEIEWLNAYNRKVYDTVAPLVSERARKWLYNKTREI